MIYKHTKPTNLNSLKKNLHACAKSAPSPPAPPLPSILLLALFLSIPVWRLFFSYPKATSAGWLKVDMKSFLLLGSNPPDFLLSSDVFLAFLLCQRKPTSAKVVI